MTRRTLLALPVALAPALSIAAPAKEVTIYLGKFDRGTGPFVRETIYMVGPPIGPTTRQVVKLNLDIRHSAVDVRSDVIRKDIFTPALQQAIYKSLS